MYLSSIVHLFLGGFFGFYIIGDILFIWFYWYIFWFYFFVGDENSFLWGHIGAEVDKADTCPAKSDLALSEYPRAHRHSFRHTAHDTYH